MSSKTIESAKFDSTLCDACKNDRDFKLTFLYENHIFIN